MPITRLDNFGGAFCLSNILGCFYTDHAQVGVLTFAASSNPTPGGTATVKITANGAGINVPGTWIKFGGDDIDPANGKINHVMVLYKDADTVYYSNKVI